MSALRRGVEHRFTGPFPLHCSSGWNTVFTVITLRAFLWLGSRGGTALFDAKAQESGELADTQSVYEEQRAANIARNERVLAALGLASPPTPTTVRRAAPREGSANSERLRRGKSERLRGARRPAAPAVMPELDAAAVSLDARPGQTAVTRPLVFGDAARAAGSSGSFASRVLKVVRAIPRGKVASYGQCAALAGSPNKARQVGKLLALGLAAHGAPWQRVINSGGSISLPAHAGGLEQRQLLTAEGVIFKAEGLQAKVVPGTFWDPSDDEIDLVLEADENI